MFRKGGFGIPETLLYIKVSLLGVGTLADKTGCVICGSWGDVSTWRVATEKSESGLAGSEDFFVKEYSDYEEGRKWVLREMQSRRKQLGQSMQNWFSRKNLKENLS